MKLPSFALRYPASLLALIFLLPIAYSGFAADVAGPTGSVVHLKRFGDTEETMGRQFFGQNDLDLKPDDTYTLTFWAKASHGLGLKISGKLSQAPWGAVGTSQQVDLTGEWQKCEVTLDAVGAVPEHTRISFSFADPAPGDVWIADLRLRNAANAESSSENLISNGRFEDGLKKWYFEGQRPGEFQVSVQSLAEANDAAAGEAKN